MSKSSTQAACAMVAVLTLTPGFARAQASDQDEVAAIKTEMARLSARLEALERR